MGLDTSHGCWNGPYSSFDEFRNEVARAGGVPHVNGTYIIPPDYTGHDYLYGQLGRSGDPKPDDIIWAFLGHSDCEGRIPCRICAELADRLEAIPVVEAHRESLKDFVDGLRDAADCGEDVTFG